MTEIYKKRNELLLNDRGESEENFLKNYDISKFERPSVTVDMLIFTVMDKCNDNPRKLPDKELKILLVKRKDHPFIGQWAIPGGFVNMDEDLDSAAKRELKEETNLENIYMEQLYTWGNVDRDPRTRVISTSYLSLVDSRYLEPKAGDDAEEVKWFSITRDLIEYNKEKTENGYIIINEKIRINMVSEDERDKIIYVLNIKTIVDKHMRNITLEIDNNEHTNNMAFDHIKIIKYALDRLINKIEYTTIAFNLLGEYFTITELQKVYEAILGKKLISPNFRRKIAPMIAETDNYKNDFQCRPAKMFTFKKEWTNNWI